MNEKPAFPQYQPHPDPFSHGMTLRDYFAAKALQGMFANPADGHENYDLNYEDYTKEIARCAYKMADAMMKAREA
jgi:hypothetical protein